MDQKNKSGFSLLEIMVAALILIVVVLGSATLLYQTGSDIRVLGNKHLAMERARSKIEWLRSFPYQTLRASAVAGSPAIGVTNETHNGITITITSTNRLITTGGILSQTGLSDNEYIKLSVLAQYRGVDETVLLHAVKTVAEEKVQQ